jgi:PAS domain S-box-containing protein
MGISALDWFLFGLLPLAALLLGAAFLLLRQRQLAYLAATAQLAQDRDRVREALAGSAFAMWEWDIASDSFHLDSNWREMLGDTPQETRTTAADIFALVHPDDAERGWQAVVRALKGETNRFDAELRVRGVDGQWRWIRSRGKVTNRGPQGVAARAVGTNVDITARKAAEQSLAESEAQFRQLVEYMPAAVVFVDREQRFAVHNRAYSELMQLPPGGVNGRLVREVLGEKRFARVEPHLSRALAGEPSRYEVRIHRNDKPIDIEVLHWPLRGANGTIEGVIVLGIDVTRLKEADRMKGHFVSVVSHELRTPLTSMRGSLGLLEGGVAGELPQEARTLVGIALQNCERLWRLVDDLLDLEKMAEGRSAFRVDALDWNAQLAGALASGRGLEKQYGVAFELAPTPPLRVMGDPDRLAQVLANLMLNAAKFSPAGGTITLSAESRPNARVRTSVRDRGPGVPAEFRSRIFRPFEQADDGDARTSTGTGLGLAISREIVEQLGGAIGFDDAPGGGAIFWFDLPEPPVAT